MTTEQRKKQGGFDLSSFPVQLLEKVEELTLYVIDQDERIRELERKNCELESRFSGLD